MALGPHHPGAVGDDPTNPVCSARTRPLWMIHKGRVRACIFHAIYLPRIYDNDRLVAIPGDLTIANSIIKFRGGAEANALLKKVIFSLTGSNMVTDFQVKISGDDIRALLKEKIEQANHWLETQGKKAGMRAKKVEYANRVKDLQFVLDHMAYGGGEFFLLKLDDLERLGFTNSFGSVKPVTED